MTILVTVLVYFGLLLLISRLSGIGNNDAFFRGNRTSPWPVVSFGMLGASLSGVTFISVPGMVMIGDMTYLQMCLGFIIGYVVISFVLLPIYYKHGLTSIYSYVGSRLGAAAQKSSSFFFLLSKLTGASARLYLVCHILKVYAFSSQFSIMGSHIDVPFIIVVLLTLCLIWCYTHSSGIKTLVWTDFLQTLCLLVSSIVLFLYCGRSLGLGLFESFSSVLSDSHSRIFEFSDWGSKQHFVKQFLSGVFITIVMTGLDQDMMQKNLTCKDLRSSQKDMCSYGLMFLPLNFLFLSIGVLILQLYSSMGISFPLKGDSLLPDLVSSGMLGDSVLVVFTIGIISSAFSSADSALTSLTTSFCIDILDIESAGSRFHSRQESTRKLVHVLMSVLFVVFILLFEIVDSPSVLDAIYTIAGYTYGPLLGLFAFCMFTRRTPRSRYIPFVAVVCPILCYLIDSLTYHYTGYKFGYEMLMFNGLLTYVGLYILPKSEENFYKNKI